MSMGEDMSSGANLCSLCDRLHGSNAGVAPRVLSGVGIAEGRDQVQVLELALSFGSWAEIRRSTVVLGNVEVVCASPLRETALGMSVP